MLEIYIEQVRATVIMHYVGILTRATIDDADLAWRDAFDAGPELIGLDFRNLVQIDSIALNHLFKLARAAEDRGIRLVVFDVNEDLRKILNVIRLDKVIPIVTKKKFETEYMSDI